MSVLLQLAALGNTRALEIIDRNIDSITDRPTLLNAVASSGQPGAGALLLRAVHSWGPDAGHPVERLHFVFGPEVVPELRKVLAEDPTDAVRRAVQLELVRFGDPQAITDLRLEMANASIDSREDAERAIELMSVAMESVNVAADAGRLFRRVDAGRSMVHRQLKQYAAGIAMWLGDRDSVEHVIGLLVSPGSDYFTYPGLRSLEEILKMHTKHTFERPEEWKAWWTSTGRATPLFTSHVAPEEKAAIINSAIAWGRMPASGPFVREPIVYLQLDSQSMEDRERTRAGLDVDIHAYTATDISLLGKAPYSVSDIETNGEMASATLGDGTVPNKWRLRTLEFAKERGAWRVVRAVEGPPAQ